MDRYECPECSYIYDEDVGDEDEGYPPGTPWAQVAKDFFCPDCGIMSKEDFDRVS